MIARTRTSMGRPVSVLGEKLDPEVGGRFMASEKHRRKRDAIARKVGGGKPAAASDGDRRHKQFGPMAKAVLKRKQSVREWTIDDGPPPGE
jgi:hypothetical protein